MNKIYKYQHGTPNGLTRENVNEGSKLVARGFNWLMGKVGNVFTSAIAASNVPSTVVADRLTHRNSKATLGKAYRANKKVIENNAVYLSPSSHLAAWTQGSMNPRVGAEVLASDPRLQSLGIIGDIATFKYAPKVVRTTGNAAVDVAARSGNKTARAYRVSRELNKNVKDTKLSSQGNNKPTVTLYKQKPMVYRTSAAGYKDWMKGDRPRTSLEDPNSAFIELRSHPDGHATVKTKHLVDREGNDITFTFDRQPRNNLLQLEFDDSHGQPVYTLSAEEVEHAVKVGLPDETGQLRKQWVGSPIAKEVEAGNPRSLTFRNMTPQQADQVVDFMDKNRGRNVYVHCLRGTSRSGAFDKFLEDYYGYSRPDKKNVAGASPEVYNTLVEAYKRKHSQPMTSLKFFE